jgi:hypothetical protein
MRSLTDFTAAIEMLVGQATAQLTADQLEAVGGLLEQLGGLARSTAEIKRAFGSGAVVNSSGAASGMPQPVSGGTGYSSPLPPAPAPSAPAPAAPPPGPTYAPPPADVDCEEAHLQRHHPDRISDIRSSSVIYCNRILYYLGQVGAHANQIPAGDPVLGAKIDDCLLSIECLPGSRPVGGLFDTEEGLLGAWQDAYGMMKKLRADGLIDVDDAQQVLVKLGDRPGGAFDEPDNSNENLRPAPKPAAMKVEAVPTMLPPGSILMHPGQKQSFPLEGGGLGERVDLVLSAEAPNPVVITPAMQNGHPDKTIFPAGISVEIHDLPEQPAPAAAEQPSAETIQ